MHVETHLNSSTDVLYGNGAWFLLQQENGEMLSPLSAAGAVAVAMQVGRERIGDTSSVSSVSSMSPLPPSSPGQALGYRGREGSFEARYQSPLDDFRVSQEALLDQENRRYAWSKDGQLSNVVVFYLTEVATDLFICVVPYIRV